MVIESKFQKKVIDILDTMFDGTVVLKNDPNYLQGVPDLLVLRNDRWAMLETKRSSVARFQPNQEYYIKLFNDMSFARSINPENMEEVLNELQQSLRSRR